MEEGYVLRPIISPSDKEFREKVGLEKWNQIKSKNFRDTNFKCEGCGFEPYDVSADEVLDLHVLEINEKDIFNSKFRTTCMLCHIIEHADVAIKNDYVKLVNSHLKQGEIVNICRNGKLHEHIENGDIRYIKKSKEEFLEELKNGKSLEGKVKFVFTEKYLSKINF